MIYCSCGGQKSCYRCDGKGWLDEPVPEASLAVSPRMSPVLPLYSQLREARPRERRKNRKPLIAKLYAGGIAPRVATAKSRKNHTSSLQVLARLIKKGKKRSNDGVTREAALAKCLTVDQMDQLTKHKREVVKLIEVLPTAGDAAEAVQRRILAEKRALRKLRIKAKKVFRRTQAPAAVPKTPV